MVNQRWRERRSTYRPAGEVIRTGEYEVQPIGELEAKAFVEAHHYSRSYPAARFRFGLFHLGTLVGVAVFSQPFLAETITNVFAGWSADDGVELGRFVLLDEVPGNGETWFLARCFEYLRPNVRGVISFADPQPRTTLAGETIFPGHVGTIYQALNGHYLGRSGAASLRLLPDGTVFSNFASGKLRRLKTGWRSAVETLRRWGADDLTPADVLVPELRIAWLERWRRELTRPMRHQGNHRYAWALDRRARRSLPDSTGPYPKKIHA